MQRLIRSLNRLRTSSSSSQALRHHHFPPPFGSSSPLPPQFPPPSPWFPRSSTFHLSSPPVAFRRQFSTIGFPVFCSRDLVGGRGARLFQFSLQRKVGPWRSFLGYRRGWRSFMSSPDMVLYGLMGANVAIFMLWRLADSAFMEKNFMISLANIKNGRLHTLITSAFSHIDADHMFPNMIGLYFFGSSIGTLFGAEFLLKMYLAGALGGSIFYVLHDLVAPLFKGKSTMYRSSIPGLGASGAVNAIMLLYIFLFPRNTIYLQFLFPVPAAVMGAFLIGSDLWRIKQGDGHVSGSAHLGGAVVAALVWARMVKHWI